MEYQLPGGQLVSINDSASLQIPGGAYLSGAQTLLLILLHDAAVGSSGIEGVVFQAPLPGQICGARVGEFTGYAFASDAEGGYAALRVPLSAFGGEALSPSDTPVVLVRNSTNTTGIIPASVIQE